MLKQLLVYGFLLVAIAARGQLVNLVPNTGFEEVKDYEYEPGSFIENHIYNWFAICGEPDLYNTNNINFQFRSPLNGNQEYYQLPNGGNSYLGLGLYIYPYAEYLYKNQRETIGVKLIQTLKPNFKYYYQYFVNFRGTDPQYTGNTDNLPIKNIGLYLHKDSINFIRVDFCNNIPLCAIPDSFPTIGVYEPTTIITDTVNWIKVSGTFIANGGEKYLYLGNFKPDSLTEFQDGFTQPLGYSYYYIDDVLLAESDTILAVEENSFTSKINIYPNPATNSVSIDIPKNYPNPQLHIYSLTGQLVATKPIQPKQPVPIIELNAGMYIFAIQSNNTLIGREKVVVY